jgi:hypothetical protein
VINFFQGAWITLDANIFQLQNQSKVDRVCILLLKISNSLRTTSNTNTQQEHEEKTTGVAEVPSGSGYGNGISPIQPSHVTLQMWGHINQCVETVDNLQHMERVQKAESTENHASVDPETKT